MASTRPKPVIHVNAVPHRPSAPGNLLPSNHGPLLSCAVTTFIVVSKSPYGTMAAGPGSRLIALSTTAGSKSAPSNKYHPRLGAPPRTPTGGAHPTPCAIH